MGYAFGVELPEDSQYMRGAPFGSTLSNPFKPPFTGRYAYDTRHHDLVIVVHGGQPACIGIMSMNRKTPICREQSTIVVPSAEYTFDALPTTVLSMLSNIEYRLPRLEFDCEMKKSAHTTSLRLVNATRPIRDMPRFPTCAMHESTAEGSWLSELLSSDSTSLPIPMVLPDMWKEDSNETGCESNTGEDADMHDSTASSRFPWFVDEGGVLADGMAYAGGGGECSTSSGAFAGKKLETAVRVLKNDVLGKYYGPSVRMDSLHILTGQYSSMYTGKITYKVDSLHETSLNCVRNAFAQNYYFAVLSVTADNSLSIEADGRGIQDTPGEGQMQWDKLISAGNMGPLGQGEVVNTSRCRVDSSTGPEGMALNSSTACQTKNLQADAFDNGGIFMYSQVHENSALEAMGPSPNIWGSGNTSQELRVASARRNHPAPLAPKLTVQSADIAVVGSPGDDIQSDVALVNQGAMHQRRGSAKDDRARRGLILEERKKRNRLSAARSNHRKKEKMEVVKRELIANRALVTELSERRKAFEVENKRLKHLLEEEQTLNVR